MKHLLTSLLFFIGLAGLAQPTYLDLTLQLDNYPGETSWEIIKTQDSTLVISSPSYQGVAPGSLVEQRIFLGAGIDYTFIITDTILVMESVVGLEMVFSYLLTTVKE